MDSIGIVETDACTGSTDSDNKLANPALHALKRLPSAGVFFGRRPGGKISVASPRYKRHGDFANTSRNYESTDECYAVEHRPAHQMEKVLIAFQQYSGMLTIAPSLLKAVMHMGPVADVKPHGGNGCDGLPAKTLNTYRSSLRSARAASTNYFNIHHRLGDALKDFALRAACAVKPVIRAIARAPKIISTWYAQNRLQERNPALPGQI